MAINRKAIETLVYSVFDALDPSGTNTVKYKKFFSSMSATEFESYMKKFLSDENENFCLDLIEFENKLKIEYAEKAAKILGIPLMEYVYLPHLTRDKNNIICTKERCLVGYINIKRTQQMLHKKNGWSISSEKRSALTGQVTGEDKNARDSDMEAFMLTAIEADNLLAELHGPRADDPHMERQMLSQINNQGYFRMEDLESISTNKVTLNTINAYLLSMGIKTDIVTDTYILPKTSEEIFD